MKVQKYFMPTRMHGTPTGRPDYMVSEKMWFLGFLFRKVVQNHYIGEVGKQSSLFSYFLSNTSAKSYRNRVVYVKIIASQT